MVAWALANAALLREGRVAEVDVAHILEELEDLGKSERRALAGDLRVLLAHLLKWQFQPGLRGPSWRLSIDNARRDIQLILDDSPSLRRLLEEAIAKEYPSARRNAVTETGLTPDQFPNICPYAADQVLRADFWP